MTLGKISVAIAFAFLVAACQVQWISNYDEQTDRNVTAYQSNLNTYFERLKDLQWPECSYKNNSTFYAEAISDATVILTRAESIQMNKQTIKQAASLRDNLQEVRMTHKENDEDEKCLSLLYIVQSQGFANQIVRALLWLEQGKKRQLGKVTRDDSQTEVTLPSSFEPLRPPLEPIKE